MNEDFLKTPIEYLKGVGPKRAEVLRREFGIFTYNDLLYYFPFRHVDKSTVYKVCDIQTEGNYMLFKGDITGYQILGEQRTKRLSAQFTDGTGTIELVWFNGIKWIEDVLKQRHSNVTIFGKPTLFNNRWNISHPEIIDPTAKNDTNIPDHFFPLYNTSDKAKKSGLDSKGVAKLTAALLIQHKYSIFPEYLPKELIENHHLLSLKEALFNIHFPENQEKLAAATLRLKFDELFYTQLKLLKLKILTERKYRGHIFSHIGQSFNYFYHNRLKFELTGAQKRVIKEIYADLGSGRQMNRLLQGDVGSGKTITALLVMLIANDNGFQSCLMAPTEILATQHYENISKMLGDMPLGVA